MPEKACSNIATPSKSEWRDFVFIPLAFALSPLLFFRRKARPGSVLLSSFQIRSSALVALSHFPSAFSFGVHLLTLASSSESVAYRQGFVTRPSCPPLCQTLNLLLLLLCVGEHPSSSHLFSSHAVPLWSCQCSNEPENQSLGRP